MLLLYFYLCKCIKFENKAIFVMSFSQSVENLRCIYIYYIDWFSDMLFKLRLAFALQWTREAKIIIAKVVQIAYCYLLSFGSFLKKFFFTFVLLFFVFVFLINASFRDCSFRW